MMHLRRSFIELGLLDFHKIYPMSAADGRGGPHQLMFTTSPSQSKIPLQRRSLPLTSAKSLENMVGFCL